jgi:hypothetical protein
MKVDRGDVARIDYQGGVKSLFPSITINPSAGLAAGGSPGRRVAPGFLAGARRFSSLLFAIHRR